MQRVRSIAKRGFSHAASLLIPLNKCRQQTLYAPWKCEEERYVVVRAS